MPLEIQLLLSLIKDRLENDKAEAEAEEANIKEQFQNRYTNPRISNFWYDSMEECDNASEPSAERLHILCRTVNEATNKVISEEFLPIPEPEATEVLTLVIPCEPTKETLLGLFRTRLFDCEEDARLAYKAIVQSMGI